MTIKFFPDEGGGTGGGTTGDEGEGGVDPSAIAQNVVNDANKTEMPVEWGKLVPEDMREKPWMKDILNAENPTERFF